MRLFLEPAANTQLTEGGSANVRAHVAVGFPSCPELQRITALWPHLPPLAKAVIKATVDAAIEGVTRGVGPSITG